MTGPMDRQTRPPGGVVRWIRLAPSAMARRAADRAGDGWRRLRSRAAARLDLALEPLRRRLGRPLPAGLAGFVFLAALLPPDQPGSYIRGDWPGDVGCLAMNIYHEARGESEQGKLAVGHVVINRMLDPRFPGTICEVITQGGQEPLGRCQFSWWCDGRDDRPQDRWAWSESRFLADRILAGKDRDPTGGALWYHADYVAPAWGRKLAPGPTIGRHKFYRDASFR